MKICYITNLYGKNARGGAERIVATEAEEMTRAGHEVTVIAGASPGWKGDDTSEVAEVIRVIPWNVYPYADGRPHGFFFRFLWHLIDMNCLRASRDVRKIVDRIHPDVVHTHNLMGLGFRVPRALRKCGVRHVHTVHDVQLLHPSGLLTEERPGAFVRLSRWAYRIAMRRLMGSPSVVIFPSEYLADLHGRYGFFPKSKKIVHSNPAPDVIEEVRRRTLENRFLFVGQLEEHKGIVMLLEVWMASESDDAVLDIVGTGTLEKDIREWVKGRQDIVLHGRQDTKQVNDAYDRATFVVVPSLVMENQPTVILEAFSRGVPVIASNMGGIPDLVVDGKTGFLFDAENPEDLKDMLSRARSTMADWSRMSENAKNRVRPLGKEPHREMLESIYVE